MARRACGPRCVKCRAVTLSRCYWCGDPVCFCHSRVDELGYNCCWPCDLKFYKQWLSENETPKNDAGDCKQWKQSRLFEPGEPESPERL